MKVEENDSKKEDKNVLQEEGGQEEEEPWDLVRLIDIDGGDASCGKGENKAVPCRTEGCQNVARVVWATLKNPADEWPMCLSCQHNDFEGFPEDHKLPDDFDFTDRTMDGVAVDVDVASSPTMQK